MTRIMIVDDDENLVELIRDSLLANSFDVETAYGGEECLSKFTEFDPQVLLLDIMMPDMNGWEVLEALGKDYDASNTKILMLTAKPLHKMDVKRNFFDNLVHYLQKPFRIEQIITVIEDVLKEESLIDEEGKKISETFGINFAESYVEFMRKAARRKRIITGVVNEDIADGMAGTVPMYTESLSRQAIIDLRKSVRTMEKEMARIKSIIE